MFGYIDPPYIDPLTDFGFKKLFGEETNKDIIMSFIRNVLELETPLVDISFLNKEQLPETSDERIGIYDIFCKSLDESYFIVEMQKNKINFMKDRMVYYTTFPIRKQAIKGKFEVEIDGERKEIEWNYELSSVYCIAVLDFTFDGKGACVKRNSIRDDKPPHNLFYDKLHYVTVELPLFDERKVEYSLDKPLNKWLYFLKWLETFEEMPEIFKEDPVFEKAFEVARVANLTRRERILYEESLKRSRDSYAIMETAEKEAREKGWEEGRKEGSKKRAIEIARSMLQKKMDIPLISELTGLTEEDVARFRKLSETEKDGNN